MSRERDEHEARGEERDGVEEAFARLRHAIEPPTEHELRAMARTASAEARPPLPAARPRWPLRLRWTAVAVAVALLAGSGLGFGLGSSATPSGTAADGPSGLGFLPERGWFVLRSPEEATAEWPSFATASSVPLHPEDQVSARAPASRGYPDATLRTLARDGVVIVASFALRGVHRPSDESFPRRALPLRLRDAAFEIQRNTYDSPRGWYEIRAAVNEHNVTVNVYFGSPRPRPSTIIAAQRQLDRLVVGPNRPAPQVRKRALPLRPSLATPIVAGAQSRLVDRTFVCSPVAFGNVRDLDIYASPPRDLQLGRHQPAYLMVLTGASAPDSMLVFVRARFQAELPGLAVPWAPGPEGVYAHTSRCSSSRTSVQLSSGGLQGPPVRWSRDLDCPVPGRVLIRVRAVLRQPAEWRRADRSYVGARNPVTEARLAVRLQKTGKPIAYMELDAKGRTALWYSSGCS